MSNIKQSFETVMMQRHFFKAITNFAMRRRVVVGSSYLSPQCSGVAYMARIFDRSISDSVAEPMSNLRDIH